MKFKFLVLHYVYGLMASCWNAGITAVKINGGIALTAAAAPKMITAPDLKMMVGIFIAASFWEAVDYFGDNPLPSTLDDLSKKAAALATSSGPAPTP